MSIDIKTLRIGSHVEYEGKRVRVHCIGPNDVMYLPCIVSSITYSTNVEDLRPIEITSGLLRELGFEGCSNESCARTVYCKKVLDKEVAFSPVDSDCWECRASYGGFDIGYCLCCSLHQAESFLALHNIELIND